MQVDTTRSPNVWFGEIASQLVAQTGTVATPTISPAGGTFAGSATVTLSSTTPTASIHYTVDGTPPTTASFLYGGPFSLSANTTVKARAFANGSESAIASATFVIQGPAATPTISPAGGSFSGAVTVTLTTSTSGATIRYTTNGTPATINSTSYAVPFSLGASSTVRAKAFATNMLDSGEASATFTITQPTVATPTISPAGGSFNSPVTVTLASTTTGADIRYTTNGVSPTINSTQYSGPFTVSATGTVKARAFVQSVQSSEASASFTITGAQTLTKIMPLGDSTTHGIGTGDSSGYRLPLWNQLSGFNVNFVGPFANGPPGLMDVDHAGWWGRTITQISQVLNGWLTTYQPDMVLVMVGLSDIDQNQDLANAPNRLSALIDQIYAVVPTSTVIVAQIPGWVGNPTKDQQTTAFNQQIPGIVAQKAAAGRRIALVDLYSLLSPSTDYADPIHPNSTGYTKIANAWFGAIAAQLSTQPPPVATPTITPAGGSFSGPVSVTLASTTSGATIRYTTDGTTPTNTAASTLYGGAFTVSATSTVKARAFAANMQDSGEASATFTIALPTVATPTITPAGGSFSGPVSVTLTSATSGATIRYTTNGTTPTNTAASTLYGGAFTVSATSTVKARAFATNMQDSGEASATFTIALPTVATPTITPAGGSFSGPVSVTLASATSGATIRYTTNGTTPTNTAASTLYGGAFTVSATSTVKARAFATNMQDSGRGECHLHDRAADARDANDQPGRWQFLRAGVSNLGLARRGSAGSVGSVLRTEWLQPYSRWPVAGDSLRVRWQRVFCQLDSRGAPWRVVLQVQPSDQPGHAACRGHHDDRG